MDVRAVMMQHKLVTYGLVSTGVVAFAVVRAFFKYANFYSAAVFLSRSTASCLALMNLGLYASIIFGKVMQHIFFGPLRPSEVERLYDRIWYFLTESLLAFTIFRDEFDTAFLVMFGILLFLKSFHWILGDRIEWMDQIPFPGPGILFHVRTIALFCVLTACDFAMLAFVLDNVFENGFGGIVLFGNEYAILGATLINYLLRYQIVCYDLRRAATRGGENAPPWQDKSMFIFYIELFTDFLKLLTYMTFFVVVMMFYGLPLNIIRDVYITARSFATRVRDLIRYQYATRNMDERYPNATAEEMAAMSDRTCIICRDEMVAPEADAVHVPDGPNMTPKKLPCGHFFHFQCLRSWLERQQSCPTCRRSVLGPAPAATNRPANGQAAPAGGAAPPNGLQNLPGGGQWQFGALDPNQLAGAWGAAWANALGQQGIPGLGQPAAPQPGQAPVPPGGGQAQPTPTPTLPSSGQQSAGGQAGTSTGSDASQPLDPRAAAREAALRRFASYSGSRGATPTPTQRNQPASTPAPPSSLFKPTQHDPRTGIPSLIPLFPPSVNSSSLPPLHLSSSHFPAGSIPQARPGISITSQTFLDRPGGMSVQALDDSLETIEEMQDSLYKAAEELTKVRSRLVMINAHHDGVEDSGDTPAEGKGKGKRAFSS